MTRSRRRKLARENAPARGLVRRNGIPVAATLLAAVPAAYAADQPETTPGGLQEVVVTAQKRTENLQSVPISVQVFDTQRLEQLGISNIDDYVKYSPSVSLMRGIGQGGNAQPGIAHVYIRGVASGGEGNHSGPQPTVGTYLDEQPVTTIDGTVDVHIYDIARIEVLAGPQGTLYGASSEAGTIRIITNKPDPSKFAAGYDLIGNTVDHGGNGYELDGFVNIPLGTSAAVRLVGFYKRDAGFIDNVAGTNPNACIENGIRTFPTWAGQPAGADYPLMTPCPTTAPVGAGAISNAAYLKNDYNTADTYGGRGALRFDLGENWTVTPTFMAQKVTTNGFFAYDPGIGDLQVTHSGPENSFDSWYQAALTVEGKFGGGFDLVYAGAFMKRNINSIADYADYSLFYDRYYGSGAFWVGDNGLPIMPQEFVYTKGGFQKWSNEVRLTTPVDKPVRATVGLFIQRQLHNIWEQYVMPGYGYTDPFGNSPNPNGFAQSLSIPTLYNTIWLTDEQRVDRDKAVFGEVTWDVTPKLSVTGGLRYYKYENSLNGFYGFSLNYNNLTGYGSGMIACFAPPSTPYAPCTNLNNTTDGSGTVPRANVTYKFTPDVLVYATYSKGFRPGGVNRTSTPGVGPYQADYLKNYEIGWKTQWFDHHLRFNGAFFWQDWNNFQFSFLGPNSVNIIQNGANARIKGVETQLEWLPTDRLLLSGGFTWLDPVLTEDYCGTQPGVTYCPDQITKPNPWLPGGQLVGPQAPAGTNLPIVPKFKGNLIARYTFGALGNWQPYAQATATYQTQTTALLRVDQSHNVGVMPAWALFDLTAGANVSNLTIEAFVNNVADRRAQMTRFVATNPQIDNQAYVVPAQPRTIGIRVAQRF
jgi:outer membrane receptor protein involved in Fe transport